MASTKSTVEDLTEKVKSRAKEVVERAQDAAADVAEDVTNAVSDTAGEMGTQVRKTRTRHRVQHAIDHAADRAHDWADRGITATFDGVDHARQAYDRYAKETTAYIRRQPVKSVFLAAGIGAALAGLLLGSLTRRER